MLPKIKLWWGIYLFNYLYTLKVIIPFFFDSILDLLVVLTKQLVSNSINTTAEL